MERLQENPMQGAKRVAYVVLSLLMAAAGGCNGASNTETAKTEPEKAVVAEAPKPAPGSDEAKVASAMSAAPEAVGKDAAVMDMGADGSMKELRAGTNGFT